MTHAPRRFVFALVCLLLMCLGPPTAVAEGVAQRNPIDALPLLPRLIHLPLVQHVTACEPIDDITLRTLSVDPPPTDRPAQLHPDLNLAIRGYVPTNADLSLVDYSGASDPGAPQLYTLFADERPPEITSAYQVNDWDWDSNSHGLPISSPAVTMISLAAPFGEIIHTPDSGYDIGQDMDALVLYASRDRLTLKYTRDDNVVHGYTVHLENLCVDSQLLALYEQCDKEGRSRLPAVNGRDPLGRATHSGVSVCIRDTGRFMDPRSAKDWWDR